MRGEEHPEALIDRALRGALDPDAQATLDQHLAVCSVCAAQLAMAPRFERELAPQPRDQALDDRALEAALRRMQETQPAARRHAPTWFRWAAAAALVVCGVTAAAAVIGRRVARRAPVQTPAPAVEAPAARAPIRPAAVAPAETPPPPEPAPAREAAKPRAPRPPAITAGALFEQGEKLRREGRADAAIATYRRLQTTFPGTAEAGLSFAFAGQLLLKQRRPDEALAQFDRHLKSGGEVGQVGEEALAGRATALEELGRRDDAIAAWKTLLARYPGSVYAGRARARLDEPR